MAGEGKSARLPIQRRYLHANFIFGVNLAVIIDLQRLELMTMMPIYGESIAHPLEITRVIDVPHHVDG